jgi:hypothetical protein
MNFNCQFGFNIVCKDVKNSPTETGNYKGHGRIWSFTSNTQNFIFRQSQMCVYILTKKSTYCFLNLVVGRKILLHIIMRD